VETVQLLFIPGQDQAQAFDGLQSFSNNQFLGTIVSYKAEQMSLNMIVWF
jgi:putative ABC transport system permease protein